LPTNVSLVRGEILESGDHVFDLRDEGPLEWRREGYRGVGRGDAFDGRVEELECLLGDRGDDLRAEAGRARVLVEDERPRGLLDRGEDGFLVPGED
jgi:hypothetical protein